MKRAVAVAAAATLIFAACGDDDDEGTTGTTEAGGGGGEEAAGAQTYEVYVDGRPDDTPMFFLAYFPNELQAHPGDTIDFEFADTGEPHTVAGGAAIDGLFDAIESSGFDLSSDAEPPAEVQEAFGAIPFVFPDDPTAPLNQGAAQPCVAESGPLPVEEACEVQEGEFNGTDELFNSGFVPGGESFEMKLADDLAPGDYTLMCLVHGPEMTVDLSVVDAATEVPSPDEVEAAGTEAMEAAFAEQADAADQVRAITDPAAAQAGGGNPEGTVPGGAAVFPEQIDISVGDSVTWQILGPHTISFNAPESARPLITVDDDGTVALNPEAGGPAGWEGPPPPPEEESDAPPPPIDAGVFSGEGFHSSSILFDPQSYKLTFDTAGTYEYLCLVHPDMEGTINVT